MRLLVDVLEGLAELRGHAGRALSTVLGVAWGTFAVVGLGAFGTGIEERMAERAAGMGSGIAVLWPSRTTLPWRGRPDGRQLLVTADEVRALGRELEGVAAISPEHTRYAVLRVGDAVYRPQLTGVDPAYGTLRNQVPQPGGRFLNARDLAERRRVVFLGDRVARQLFGERDPLGQEVILADVPFRVVGVLAPRIQDSDYGATDDARAFLPATTFEQLFGARYVEDFVLRADEPAHLPRVIDGVFATLGRRLGFDPADRSALLVWDTTEGDRIRTQAFGAMNLMMLLAGVFTVLVGAIGVGNLLFLLVRRRTGELGLRMALGARPRALLLEVLGEAFVLIAVGGGLGALAAGGLAFLVGASPLAEDLGQPRISTGLALGVAGLLALVGLAAGWFPARRAARLDPVAALAEAR